MKIETENLKKGIVKRLTLGNEGRNDYQSYFVPIDELYFNDQNGRIATYIEEDGGKAKQFLCEGKKEEYNDIIAGYIKESADDNLDSFKKTKADIKEKGQRIPGVILDDGRIIDGNRRFSCIRELKKETGDRKFGYFECVVLPSPKTKDQEQEIKILELNIQFNDDDKRDYSPIDKLTSFYNDTRNTESPNCIDKSTYCHAAGRKTNEYEKYKLIVETRLDYLEWLGKPKAFSVLKKEKLDGPLEDIASKRKKRSAEEWNKKKRAIYSCRTFNNSGDRTRNIREIRKSALVDGPLYQKRNRIVEDPNYIFELPKALAIKDKKPETPEETTAKKEFLNDKQQTFDSALREGRIEENSKQFLDSPKKTFDDVIKKLGEIQTSVLGDFPDASKKDLLNQISKIQDRLSERKKALEDEDFA